MALEKAELSSATIEAKQQSAVLKTQDQYSGLFNLFRQQPTLPGPMATPSRASLAACLGLRHRCTSTHRVPCRHSICCPNRLGACQPLHHGNPLYRRIWLHQLCPLCQIPVQLPCSRIQPRNTRLHSQKTETQSTTRSPIQRRTVEPTIVQQTTATLSVHGEPSRPVG